MALKHWNTSLELKLLAPKKGSSSHSISIHISRHKYTLDLLKEIGKLEAKPADTPIEKKSWSTLSERKPLHNQRLIYLTIMWSDSSYVVKLVSQFMHALKTGHLAALHRILKYLKVALRKAPCINLVDTWKRSRTLMLIRQDPKQKIHYGVLDLVDETWFFFFFFFQYEGDSPSTTELQSHLQSELRKKKQRNFDFMEK